MVWRSNVSPWDSLVHTAMPVVILDIYWAGRLFFSPLLIVYLLHSHLHYGAYSCSTSNPLFFIFQQCSFYSSKTIHSAATREHAINMSTCRFILSWRGGWEAAPVEHIFWICHSCGVCWVLMTDDKYQRWIFLCCKGFDFSLKKCCMWQTEGGRWVLDSGGHLKARSCGFDATFLSADSFAREYCKIRGWWPRS